MPFFFIGAAWIFCLFVGLILLCFRPLRFLSTYLIFGSTGLTFISFALSTLVLLAIGHFPQRSSHLVILAIIGYFGAIVAGGCIGAVVGLIVGHKVNRKFRLIESPHRNRCGDSIEALRPCFQHHIERGLRCAADLFESGGFQYFRQTALSSLCSQGRSHFLCH